MVHRRTTHEFQDVEHHPNCRLIKGDKYPIEASGPVILLCSCGVGPMQDRIKQLKLKTKRQRKILHKLSLIDRLLKTEDIDVKIAQLKKLGEKYATTTEYFDKLAQKFVNQIGEEILEIVN